MTFVVNGRMLTANEVSELSVMAAEVTETARVHWRENVLAQLEKRSRIMMEEMLNPRHPTEDMTLITDFKIPEE